MRSGANTTPGKWGWKLFARKGNRNTAVAALARKLLVQVWRLLFGNPPAALEADKSLATKLQKLIVVLGKDLRVKIGLPANINECVLELQRRMLHCPTATP